MIEVLLETIEGNLEDHLQGMIGEDPRRGGLEDHPMIGGDRHRIVVEAMIIMDLHPIAVVDQTIIMDLPRMIAAVEMTTTDLRLEVEEGEMITMDRVIADETIAMDQGLRIDTIVVIEEDDLTMIDEEGDCANIIFRDQKTLDESAFGHGPCHSTTCCEHSSERLPDRKCRRAYVCHDP